MLPNPLYHAKVPPGDRWAMQHLPFYARWFRFVMLYPGIAMGTEQYRIDPGLPRRARASRSTRRTTLRRQQLTAWITMHLEDRPDLIEKSIPDYPAMGKRILQDNGSWLRTLKKPNVELVHTGIERIVARRCASPSTARIHDADVICYATGFRHNDFLASMDVTGRNGVSLRDQWGDEPTAYLGITIPNFPNLFCMYGPGTNLAHGASLFFHSECQIHYAMDCIHRVLAAGAQTIEVRKDAHDEYVERYRPRSTSSCGHTRRSSTATTRTRRARSSRCRRGRSSCTGSGPDRPTPSSTSSAEPAVGHPVKRGWIATACTTKLLVTVTVDDSGKTEMWSGAIVVDNAPPLTGSVNAQSPPRMSE